MTATVGPNLGLNYAWANGEDGWNTGMDANLLKMDTVVQLRVKNYTLTTPPGSPTNGDRYIVATGSTGAWSGQDGKLAVYISGAWTFYSPSNGWLAKDENSGLFISYNGSSWVTDPFGDRAYADAKAANYATTASFFWDFDREDMTTSSYFYRQTGGDTVQPDLSEITGITGYKSMSGWSVLKLNSTVYGDTTSVSRYVGSYLVKGATWHTGDTYQAIFRVALRDRLPSGSDDFEYRIGCAHLGLSGFGGDWFSTSPTDTADGAAAYFLVDKNSGFFQCKSGWTTSLETTVTSVTASLNTIYSLRIKVDGSGYVYFYINGTLVATHSVAGVIPDEKCLGEVVAIRNNAATTNAIKSIVIDAIGYKHSLNTNRNNLAFE